MKTYIKTLIFVAVITVSCTRDFEEINTDPNNPTEVPTSFLMTNAQRDILMSYLNNFGLLYSQHWAQTRYTDVSLYLVDAEASDRYYIRPLADIQRIIELNMDEGTKNDAAVSGANENQLAICRILKVLVFQIITDVWGEIPYSEALKGSDNLSPKYDTQEAIYADFVKELSEAAEQINLNAPGMEGDVIYGGNMEAWRLFANSLKLRVGIRMTEVNPVLARETVESAFAGGVFTTNNDNALYTYLDDANNFNPYYQYFLTASNFAISNTLVNYMDSINDPRLAVYADPAPSSNTIVGMPYGISNAEAGSIPLDAISLPGQAVRQPTTKGTIMTHSEVLFIMAEAAQRGWDVGGETAETLYNKAITASMEYWGVDALAINTYLAHPDVVYNPDNFRQSIGDQKWISLYMNGIESWSEWRRLDYPLLKPAPDAGGREIPRRRAYDQREKDANGSNVAEAISRQGPDVMETRVWWDK